MQNLEKWDNSFKLFLLTFLYSNHKINHYRQIIPILYFYLISSFYGLIEHGDVVNVSIISLGNNFTIRGNRL